MQVRAGGFAGVMVELDAMFRAFDDAARDQAVAEMDLFMNANAVGAEDPPSGLRITTKIRRAWSMRIRSSGAMSSMRLT